MMAAMGEEMDHDQKRWIDLSAIYYLERQIVAEIERQRGWRVRRGDLGPGAVDALIYGPSVLDAAIAGGTP
jgi:hypothetical protein